MKRIIWRVVFLLIGLLGLGLAITVLAALSGFYPRSGIEADFQRIINDAQISDRYDGGWDRQDVSKEVCGRVNVEMLQDLGMSKTPILPMQTSGEPPMPTYFWEISQDKGLIAACRNHSQRYVRIQIDAETLSCTAEVSVMPTCDP